MGGGGNKGECWRGDSSMIYLMYDKNFCKCHNVHPPSTKQQKRVPVRIK
jgi:hypothetical protein